MIETAFSKLEQAILGSEDYGVVKRAHESYLQFLIAKSFLRHPVGAQRAEPASLQALYLPVNAGWAVVVHLGLLPCVTGGVESDQ